MDPVTGFLVGLGLMLLLAGGALLCFQRSFTAILVELCGAEHRARFWTRLYDSLLLLLVFFFSLWAPPGARQEHFEFSDLVAMFRTGVFGLLVGLGALAFLMLIFIGRHDRDVARESRRSKEGAQQAS